MVVLGILKWFRIVATREGVGLNSEQFTITMPMSFGFRFMRSSRRSAVRMQICNQDAARARGGGGSRSGCAVRCCSLLPSCLPARPSAAWHGWPVCGFA